MRCSVFIATSFDGFIAKEDGGATIQSFINLKLINEITIIRAPILLGAGKPLFGKTFKDIKLEEARVEAFPNDFIQIKYKVNYL